MIIITLQFLQAQNTDRHMKTDTITTLTHAQRKHTHATPLTHSDTHTHRSSGPWGAVRMLGRERMQEGSEVVVRCQIKCHLLLCQWSNSLLKAWPFALEELGQLRNILEEPWRYNKWLNWGGRVLRRTHPGPYTTWPGKGCVQIKYK